MPYLVDGYNLSRRSGQFKQPSSRETDAVVRYLNRFARLKRTKVTVVFDGFPHDGDRSHALSSTFDAIKIIYAGADSDADGRIRKLVASLKNRAGWIVVSSDRAVYGYARASGVRAMRSEEFLQSANALLSQQGKDEVESTGGEVEYWLKIFGEPKKGTSS
ncbi:MAG: NYN domain-containing protein [Acidobacteriia bacterium]|nr:NYN domain-containing protein [Terriglobia bacterium]